MQKTILLTGATDGLGAEAAILMASQGHNLIVHGRDEARLQADGGADGRGARGFAS